MWYKTPDGNAVNLNHATSFMTEKGDKFYNVWAHFCLGNYKFKRLIESFETEELAQDFIDKLVVQLNSPFTFTSDATANINELTQKFLKDFKEEKNEQTNSYLRAERRG